jgi:hypothetical protein
MLAFRPQCISHLMRCRHPDSSINFPIGTECPAGEPRTGAVLSLCPSCASPEYRNIHEGLADNLADNGETK